METSHRSPILRFLTDIDRRKEAGRNDSDVTYFHELLNLGEFYLKLTTLGLVAGIQSDLDRNRYRQLYRLVRANGLGEWVEVLRETLTGPASQSLDSAAHREQRELTERVSAGAWQREASGLLEETLRKVGESVESPKARASGLDCLSDFVRLRNATRGHGTSLPDRLAATCPNLEESLFLIRENFSLFRRPWAYLRRNLSGKYKVVHLGGDQAPFDTYKTSSEHRAEDGLYVWFSKACRIDSSFTESDATDLFLPNGGFTETTFEQISYMSGSKRHEDSKPYLTPSTELPLSETNGLPKMDVRGKCHTNLPPPPVGYVERQEVESKLRTVLRDDHHPIITLAGRGGIGKTWLALRVLDEIASAERFDVVLWFSARDIDLTGSGPKLVKPAVMTRRDVAQAVVRLLEPGEANVKSFDAEEYLGRLLANQDLGPTLYVFDNFETMQDPAEVFTWLDQYVRNPNKILITTRVRDFKGDYPVDVPGMTDSEAEALVTQTAATLGIRDLIADDYREQLIRESGGHPYVIKVLLGDVARTGAASAIRRLTAGQDKVLEALFERTWVSLSPAASRCLLTLSSWRSAVSKVAFEAVLLRPENDRIDVDAALDELGRFSLLEAGHGTEDNEQFVWLPLVTFEFGRKKLATSPIKDEIASDVAWLQKFGAVSEGGIPRTLDESIRRFVRAAVEHLASDMSGYAGYRAILEFIAAEHPPTWLLLSEFHEEVAGQNGLNDALTAAERHVEEVALQGDIDASGRGWLRIAELRRRRGDRYEHLLALVEAGVCFDSIDEISSVANRVNSLIVERLPDVEERRQLVERLAREMQSRLSQASATDCSRLAWLYLHMGQDGDAEKVTRAGLEKDSQNGYCRQLADRLQILPI